MRRPRARAEGVEVAEDLAEPRRLHRVTGGLDELVQAAVEQGAAMPQRRAPLERQEVHRDGPALVDLTEGAVARYYDVVEEDLGELLETVHRLDRAHRDARGVHVDEERGDTTVRGVRRPGAGEEDAAPCVLREARPDLLPGDAPAVVDAYGAALQRCEVAAGTRLGEALAPRLVTAQKPRHHRCRQRGRRIVDHRRR